MIQATAFSVLVRNNRNAIVFQLKTSYQFFLVVLRLEMFEVITSNHKMSYRQSLFDLLPAYSHTFSMICALIPFSFSG